MPDLHPHSEPHPDVAGYLLGALDAEEAEVFVAHLAGCDACRSELDELAEIPGLLADVPDTPLVPPGLEERTFAAIEAAVMRTHEPIPSALDLTIVGLPAGRHLRLRPLLAVAAAVVVIAAGVAAVVSRRASAPAPLATVHLIAAVSGQPGSGTAVIRPAPSGITIDMTVVGLPPAPPGTMYTCWLVAGDDTLAHPDRVSVGSFVVRGPTVEAHWTTAADLRRFPHIGITIEPDNGNPSHQGPKVLSAA